MDLLKAIADKVQRCNFIYDQMDETFGKLDRALEDRITNPHPGINAAIIDLENKRDAYAHNLDAEMKEIGYFVLTGINLGKIEIREVRR